MGVVTSMMFAARNADKCVRQGDRTRGAVALCQSVGTLDSVSSSSLFSSVINGTGSVLKGADKAMESVFGSETVGKMVEATGASSNLGAVAQSAVNPLLCISAGIRVLKDDDQYAALIEETAAMGAMFGCEALMKYARSAVTNSKQATTGLAGKVASTLNKSNGIKGLAEKVSNWYKGLASTSGGSAKQMLVKVGVDVLFVCGSILAYNAGKKIGEALSHRDKEKAS